MQSRNYDIEDFYEENHEQTEWDEWAEEDNARRYHDYQSENVRPY
jgi:hypothetical protein